MPSWRYLVALYATFYTLCPSVSAAGVITGLTSDNKIFELNVSSGEIVLRSYQERQLQDGVDGSNVTLGTSCGKHGQSFFFLSRSNQTVSLMNVDMKTSKAVRSPLPFYPLSTAAEFRLGLDFYLSIENKDIERSANLSLVGPDEIQFIHMLEAEIQKGGKLGFNDILQYSGGLRLARGQAVFDSARQQHWLQVVYDVSNTTNSIVTPSAYLKRYDIKTGSLIDVIPDFGTSAILQFDDATSNIFAIGWCQNIAKRRCLFRIEDLSHGDMQTSSPTVKQLYELPWEYDLIMSGVSSIDSGILYIVARKRVRGISRTVNHTPSSVLVCHGGELGICERFGDAKFSSNGKAIADKDKNFAVIGVDLSNGHVVQEKPLRMRKDGSVAEYFVDLTCGV